MKGDYAMSVQFVKEAVCVMSPMRAKPQQMAVEAEAALPGGLRDEVRIMYTGARAVPQLCEVSGGRVTVSGRVDFCVLYAQGDLTRVKVAEVSRDFSIALTVSSGTENAQFQPLCEVSNVSARVFNGRLLLQTEMNVYAEAMEAQEMMLVTSVQEKDTEVLQTGVQVQQIVGDGSAQGLARGEFEISDALSVTEALFAQAEARVEDIVGGADGRATVTGTIDLAACFASSLNGRPVVCSNHSLPFEETVALGGEMGDMLSATAEVTDTAVALEGDENGRVLRAEVGLRVKVQSILEQNVRVIADAFAISGGELLTEGNEVSFCTELINEQTAESARVQLHLPDNSPRIKTVLSAFVQPVLAGAREAGGKLNVDMMLRTTLLYMTEESGIPVSFTAEEPLRLTFACQAAAEDMLSLSASLVEASMVASDRAEIRCVVTLHASGARYWQAFALSDMVREENSAHVQALALYITQPGERLWDVMKRYRLSEKALKALNDQAAEYAVDMPLPLSTRLIAYKR